MHTKDFKISFAGLALGVHQFNRTVEATFFESFDIDEIHGGGLTVDLQLEKKSNMLVLTFALVGKLDMDCDRCGENFQYSFDSENTIYIKFGGEEDLITDEDLVILPVNAHEIDISQYVYEFITLGLPLKKVHENDSCNPEIIKKLEALKPEEIEKNETDPRWKALEQLKRK